MFPIFKYTWKLLKSVGYVLLYYLAMIASIYIIGFCNIGREPLEDIYRIGSSIVSTQIPWMLMMSLFILAMYINLFISEKKKNPDWYGFNRIPSYSYGTLLILAFVINIAISAIVNHFVPQDGNASVETMKNLGEVYPLLLLICTGVVHPLFEELMFRFLIFHNLEIFGFWPAAILSSLMFGLMHSTLSQILYAFTCGIILCMVNKNYKSIVPSIATHCFINSFTVLISVI